MDFPDGGVQGLNTGMPRQGPKRSDGSKSASSGSDQTLKLKEAAQAFEAYFIQSLLKEMRRTQPKGGLFGEGSGKEIYQSLFDQKIAQKMTESGGIGLSKVIIKNLPPGLKNLEASTDRREATNGYDQFRQREPLGVRDEDTR